LKAGFKNLWNGATGSGRGGGKNYTPIPETIDIIEPRSSGIITSRSRSRTRTYSPPPRRRGGYYYDHEEYRFDRPAARY
jgi:hypothetical protein